MKRISADTPQLGRLPRSYQVTPKVLGRRRTTRHIAGQANDRQAIRGSVRRQPETYLPGRTSPTTSETMTLRRLLMATHNLTKLHQPARHRRGLKKAPRRSHRQNPRGSLTTHPSEQLIRDNLATIRCLAISDSSGSAAIPFASGSAGELAPAYLNCGWCQVQFMAVWLFGSVDALPYLGPRPSVWAVGDEMVDRSFCWSDSGRCVFGGPPRWWVPRALGELAERW
jgi:hypothetical protein